MQAARLSYHSPQTGGLRLAEETTRSKQLDSIRHNLMHASPMRRRRPAPRDIECEASSAHASEGAASISYSLGLLPTTRFFQQAWNRNRSSIPSISGPVAFLIGLAAIFLTFFLALRELVARRVRSCQCCKGFGIMRCALCKGKGSVGWKAKLSYKDACPLCMTKRFVNCPDCGGFTHRHIFSHLGGKGVGFTNG